MTTVDTKKRFMLHQLRNSEEMFVLFSKCTRMPYVHCDEETYNDQIYLFRTEKDAINAAKEYEAEGEPMQVLKFANENFLNFYSSLYFLGVNTMIVDKGQEQMEVSLQELVTPPDFSQMPEGKIRVDNPGFQLTAMYLMQKLRKAPGIKPDEEMKALEEELIVNMRKGKYIVPVQEDNKQVPLMKVKEDELFQPVFTDVHEFQKFNNGKNFKGAVIPYEKLSTIVVEQAQGIVINPLGVHIVMKKEQLK